MTTRKYQPGPRPLSTVDFRDDNGVSSVSCVVCGNLAAGWDPIKGVVYHATASEFVFPKRPCLTGNGR